jgi:DNA-binding NtrC family response regulator
MSLSEIEFEDLMQVARPAATSVAAVGAHQQNVMEETRGEDDMMKINGTFTKGPIQQSAESIEQASKSVEVEAAPISVEGSLTVEQAIRLIADKMTFPVEGLDFNSVVDQFENILILQALERTGWNRNRAAGLLRLNRTTLVEKLKKKQLMPPVRYGQEGILEGNA